MDPRQMLLAQVLQEGAGPRQFKNRQAEEAWKGTGQYQENLGPAPNPLQNYNPRPDYQDSDIVKRQLMEIERKKKMGPPPEMLKRQRMGMGGLPTMLGMDEEELMRLFMQRMYG